MNKSNIRTKLEKELKENILKHTKLEYFLSVKKNHGKVNTTQLSLMYSQADLMKQLTHILTRRLEEL